VLPDLAVRAVSLP